MAARFFKSNFVLGKEGYIFMNKYLFAVVFMPLLFCFSSCNFGHDKKVIAFSQCSEDEWRTAMNNEVLQEASFHPDVEIRIKSVKDDTQQQIRDVEQFIADKVDLIVLAPNEAIPLTSVVEKAMDAGIPVVLADRKIASKRYTAFVGADNYEVGRDAGIYIAERLKDGGRILEVRGLDGSTPATERHNGFMSVIGEYPEIKVVSSVDGAWFRDVAQKKTEQFLAGNQSVDLIFAHNDQMALGAYEAYRDAGLERPDIIGIDALAGPSGGIQMVLDDVIDATFFYPTGGERVVQTALRILNGESYSRDNRLYTAVVDKTNARVLKLQTDQVTAKQNQLQRLNEILNESLMQYSVQRILLFGSLAVLLIICVLLLLLVRAYRKSSRTNKLLESQNTAINKQKAELAEQRDQLMVLSRNLEEATQAKLVFFTNISHEFRTPLTLISGPLDTLMEREQLSQEGRQLALLIQKNVQILQRLINQIIDFRKVENGKMNMSFAPGDFKQFLCNITESFRNLAVTKHLHLGFIASDGDFSCWYDAEKVEKIFFNLLSNAFKYTPENGKITVKLEKRLCENGSMLQVRVMDTGIGIKAEHVPHIFERFYKADEVASGSGIGLALTKMLVELHGGTIFVQSEPGKGSTFVVSLPFLQSENSPMESGNMSGPSAGTSVMGTVPQEEDEAVLDRTAAGTSERPLVLVVEDNADVRLYVKTLLSDEYELVEAADGLDGFQKAVQHMPDLIISDVMMDGMDGFELCRQLKGDISTCHIPVMLLTACSLDEQRAQGFENGADAYIPKPFNENLLKVRIRSMIANRKRLKEYFNRNLTFGDGKTRITEMDKSFMDKFRKIVMDNLSDNELNVDEIGRNLGMSRIQLYRKIKALTNYAPNELVRAIRLKEAGRLLISSGLTVAEIAYDTGFSSPSYFTKCFKEYFNESPTEYQNRLKHSRGDS